MNRKKREIRKTKGKAGKVLYSSTRVISTGVKGNKSCLL